MDRMADINKAINKVTEPRRLTLEQAQATIPNNDELMKKQLEAMGTVNKIVDVLVDNFGTDIDQSKEYKERLRDAIKAVMTFHTELANGPEQLEKLAKRLEGRNVPGKKLDEGVGMPAQVHVEETPASMVVAPVEPTPQPSSTPAATLEPQSVPAPEAMVAAPSNSSHVVETPTALQVPAEPAAKTEIAAPTEATQSAPPIENPAATPESAAPIAPEPARPLGSLDMTEPQKAEKRKTIEALLLEADCQDVVYLLNQKRATQTQPKQ